MVHVKCAIHVKICVHDGNVHVGVHIHVCGLYIYDLVVHVKCAIHVKIHVGVHVCTCSLYLGSCGRGSISCILTLVHNTHEISCMICPYIALLHRPATLPVITDRL